MNPLFEFSTYALALYDATLTTRRRSNARNTPTAVHAVHSASTHLTVGETTGANKQGVYYLCLAKEETPAYGACR